MGTLDQFEAALWLGVPGVGSQTLCKIETFLRSRCLEWSDSWQQLEQLRRVAILNQRQYDQSVRYQTTKWSARYLKERLTELDIWLTSYHNVEYPALLKQSSAPPFLLFGLGSKKVMASLAHRPAIAVVGTRKITPYGKLVTDLIVRDLVAADTIIVSGGMYGVDAAAHAAALANGGTTIAVLAAGLAHHGPYWQQALHQQILAGGGVLLSEFFPWSGSTKIHFPIRNRVVAGLAQAVVVTEAAVHSGSMITAQCALDYGREVCAVPGPVTSLFSEGTSWLINQGATLVRTGSDVLATFSQRHAQGNEQLPERVSKSVPPELSSSALTPNIAGDQVAAKVGQFLHQVGSGTTTQLADQLNLTVTELLPVLSQLELNGQVCQRASRWHLAS